MKYVTMYQKLTMPALGTGTNTFGKVNHEFMGDINFDTKELLSAFSLGYRLIDTAILYRNEAVIGKAIKESGIPRGEFFVTTKIPEKNDYTLVDRDIRTSIDNSLKALDIGYIDLYLLHFPLEHDHENLRVWSILESYVFKGLINSIGVCNFNESQLTYLINNATIKPAVHQFQSFPGYHQQHLIDFCKKHDIIPQAYHSIAKTSDDVKKVLSDIGLKYNKSWSQVTLNYQISQGMVVIPKSHNPEHQQSNIDIFDFTLSEEDIAIIKDL